MFTLALGAFGGETAQPIGRQAFDHLPTKQGKYTIHSTIDDRINPASAVVRGGHKYSEKPSISAFYSCSQMIESHEFV